MKFKCEFCATHALMCGSECDEQAPVRNCLDCNLSCCANHRSTNSNPANPNKTWCLSCFWRKARGQFDPVL